MRRSFASPARRKRPFVIDAAGGSVQALGTAFIVRVAAERVLVGVLDGVVRVSPTAKSLANQQAAVATVQAGQQMKPWSPCPQPPTGDWPVPPPTSWSCTSRIVATKNLPAPQVSPATIRHGRVLAFYAYTDAEVTKDNTLKLGNRLIAVPKLTGGLWTTY